MVNAKTIADKADIIVNGYAFLYSDDKVTVVDLNNTDSVSVFDKNDEIIETTMNKIERSIITDYYLRNKKYLEDMYA